MRSSYVEGRNEPGKHIIKNQSRNLYASIMNRKDLAIPGCSLDEGVRNGLECGRRLLERNVLDDNSAEYCCCGCRKPKLVQVRRGQIGGQRKMKGWELG